jgi:hypothetical protein
MWTSESIIKELLINLVAGVIIFLLALHWRFVTSYLSMERAFFRRLFGIKAFENKAVTITLDTYRDIRLLPQDIQQGLGVQYQKQQRNRFFKIFPDGHATAFPGAFGDILGYCSARGAAYLIDKLGTVPGVSVNAVSDEVVTSQWEGTSINLGSSASNIKTNDIKLHSENTWLADDLGVFRFKDGNTVAIEDRADKGIILKLRNPYFKGYAVLICAGLGEWGTSGAAWFLSQHWKLLSCRFGNNPFLIVVSVTPGSDESAHEIRAYGYETIYWRVRSRLIKPKQ